MVFANEDSNGAEKVHGKITNSNLSCNNNSSNETPKILLMTEVETRMKKFESPTQNKMQQETVWKKPTLASEIRMSDMERDLSEIKEELSESREETKNEIHKMIQKFSAQEKSIEELRCQVHEYETKSKKIENGLDELKQKSDLDEIRIEELNKQIKVYKADVRELVKAKLCLQEENQELKIDSKKKRKKKRRNWIKELHR